MNHIVAWLNSARRAGARLSRTAILCRYNRQVDRVLEYLKARDIEASRTPSDQRDAVNVLTMHSSKGLEFEYVAIPDLGAMPAPKSTEVDDARLLYVAMTRATNELLLTHHSDGVFTRDLTQRLAATN